MCASNRRAILNSGNGYKGRKNWENDLPLGLFRAVDGSIFNISAKIVTDSRPFNGATMALTACCAAIADDLRLVSIAPDRAAALLAEMQSAFRKIQKFKVLLSKQEKNCCVLLLRYGIILLRRSKN